MIYCIAPPIMEKTTEREPRIFSQIYLCCCISDGMYRIRKWRCHGYHSSMQFPFTPLLYTKQETFVGNGAGKGRKEEGIDNHLSPMNGGCLHYFVKQRSMAWV